MFYPQTNMQFYRQFIAISLAAALAPVPVVEGAVNSFIWGWDLFLVRYCTHLGDKGGCPISSSFLANSLLAILHLDRVALTVPWRSTTLKLEPVRKLSSIYLSRTVAMQLRTMPSTSI